MSIALIVTRGYGNGTLTGSIKDVVTRGYTIGVEENIWTEQPDQTTTWSKQTDQTATWTKQTDQTIVWTKQQRLIMTTVTGTFTAVGNSANLFTTEDKDITYQLTGGATATVLLERSDSGGASWDLVGTFTGSIKDVDPRS